MRFFPEAAWMHTAKAKGRVIDTWREERPMHDWLDAHVGPSELPPPDAEW
jgi:hypothetical protein